MGSLPLLALEECQNHKVTLETDDLTSYCGILTGASSSLDCTLAEVDVEYKNQEKVKKEDVYVPGRRINCIVLPPSVAERVIRKRQKELENKENKREATPTTQHQGVTYKQSPPQKCRRYGASPKTTPKNNSRESSSSSNSSPHVRLLGRIVPTQGQTCGGYGASPKTTPRNNYRESSSSSNSSPHVSLLGRPVPTQGQKCGGYGASPKTTPKNNSRESSSSSNSSTHVGPLGRPVSTQGQKLQLSPVQNNQQDTASIPQFHENVQYSQSSKQTGSKEVQGAQSSQQQQPQTQNVRQERNDLFAAQSEAAGQNYCFYEVPAIPQLQGYQFYPIPQQQLYSYIDPSATQGQQQIPFTVSQQHQQQCQYYVQDSQHIHPNPVSQVPMQYEPGSQDFDPNQAYTSGFVPPTQQSFETQPVVYYQVPIYEQPQWPTNLHQPHTHAVQPEYVYTYPQFDPNVMYQTVPSNVSNQMQPPPPPGSGEQNHFY